MSSGVRRRRHAWMVLMSCAMLMLTACSDAPSVGVLGAYFPDWLFCIVGGVLLVVCVHVLLSRSGRGAWLAPPAIVYPALTVLFSIALWVAGFNL
ncbi:YtcA family lipoprotein [Paraburkholderia fungorum]|uniref:YtcA family lipoprotein n=1 Tax=Paraburkholderia fungorum TaxID=134537 RepID=UPI0038BCCB5C